MVSLRLVLFWLVGRQEEAIRRMVQCLRPGGWLVDEETEAAALSECEAASYIPIRRGPTKKTLVIYTHLIDI